jgi:hypothetical protein
MDGNDFIAMCRSELDRLTEQTPDIPKKIEHQFLRQFEDLLQTDFYPPELQDLHPVEIYREDPKVQREADVLANAALAFQRVLPTARSQPKEEEEKATEVVLQVAKPAPVGPISVAEAKEKVSQELSELTRLGTVSSRISQRLQNKALQVRQGAVATFAHAAAVVDEQVATVERATETAADVQAVVDKSIEPFFIENP